MIARDRIKFAMLASKIQPLPLDEPRRPVKFSTTPGEIHEALARNPFDRRTWHMLADSLAEHGKPALSEAVRELASNPEVEEQSNANSGGPRLMIGPKPPHTYEYLGNHFIHGTIAGVPVDIRGRYLHVESGDGKRVYGTNYVKAKHIKEIAKEVDGKPDMRTPYDRLSRSARDRIKTAILCSRIEPMPLEMNRAPIRLALDRQFVDRAIGGGPEWLTAYRELIRHAEERGMPEHAALLQLIPTGDGLVLPHGHINPSETNQSNVHGDLTKFLLENPGRTAATVQTTSEHIQGKNHTWPTLHLTFAASPEHPLAPFIRGFEFRLKTLGGARAILKRLTSEGAIGADLTNGIYHTFTNWPERGLGDQPSVGFYSNGKTKFRPAHDWELSKRLNDSFSGTVPLAAPTAPTKLSPLPEKVIPEPKSDTLPWEKKLARHGTPVKMSATPEELHEFVSNNPHDLRAWSLLADSLEESGKPHSAQVIRDLVEHGHKEGGGVYKSLDSVPIDERKGDAHPAFGHEETYALDGSISGTRVTIWPPLLSHNQHQIDSSRPWVVHFVSKGGHSVFGLATPEPALGAGMLNEIDEFHYGSEHHGRIYQANTKSLLPQRLSRTGAPIRMSATPLDIHSELINNRHDPRLWHLLADSVEELGKPALAAHFRVFADQGAPGNLNTRYIDLSPDNLNMTNNPLFENGITARAAGMRMRFLPMSDSWMVRLMGPKSEGISIGWLHPHQAIPILHEMDDEPENDTLASAKATFPLKAKLRRGTPIRMSATPAEIHDAVTENAHDRRLWHLLADSLEEHGKPAIAGALRHLAATGNEAATTTGYRYLRNNMERDGTFGRNEVGTISGVPVYIFDDGRIWIDAKKSAPSPGILSAPIGVARDVFEEFDNPSAEHQSEVHPEKYSRRQPIRFSATPQEIHAAISENPHDRRLWALLADSMEEAGKPWFGKAMREIGSLAEQQHSPHFGGIMSHWIDVPRDDHGGMNLEAKSQGNVSGIPIIMYRFHRNQSIIGINSGPLDRWYMAVMHKNGIQFNPIGIYGLMDPEHGARIHNEIDEFKGQVPYHHDVEDLRSHDEYRPNRFQRIKFARPDQHEEMWKAIADRPGDTRTWALYSDMVREEGHQHLADAIQHVISDPAPNDFRRDFPGQPSYLQPVEAYGKHAIPGIKACIHHSSNISHVDLFIPGHGWSTYSTQDINHIRGMMREFSPWINKHDPDNDTVGAPKAHNTLRAVLGMLPFKHAPIELKKDSRPTRFKRATMIRAIKAKRAA